MNTPLRPPSVIHEEQTVFQSPRGHGIDTIIIHAIAEHIWWPEELSGVTSRHVPVLEWLSEPVAGRQSGVSAHCYIDPGGTVHVLCPDDRKAWHAGKSKMGDESDLNRIALGVELVVAGKHDYGSFLQRITTDCYSAEQYAALGWLVYSWMLSHPSITHARVVAHSDVSGDDVCGPGKGKKDPGPGFNWQRFWREAEKWADEL